MAVCVSVQCLIISSSPLVIGENIRINLMIDNSSSANVKPRATFYQTQIYMTGERHKTVENSLTEAVEGEEVAAHTIVEDTTISVEIPVNIPLSIKSDLITVKYLYALPSLIADLPSR